MKMLLFRINLFYSRTMYSRDPRDLLVYKGPQDSLVNKENRALTVKMECQDHRALLVLPVWCVPFLVLFRVFLYIVL